MNFEESKTKECLEKALQGEALAHLKYQFYKSTISNYSKEYESIFKEIIHNEKEHGKIWFKKLHDGSVPNNLDNLFDAIQGETYEHLEMYPKFSEIAKEEGYDEISELFSEIAKIEGYHSKEFERLRNEIQEKENFKSDENTIWKCLNCGFKYEGDEALDECPVCSHPQKYFIKV